MAQDTYTVEFDVMLTKSFKIEANDEDDALGKLYEMLEKKNIERARLQDVKVKLNKIPKTS